MADTVFGSVQFVASKSGKTGLTVAGMVTIYEVAKADSSLHATVATQNAIEIGNGFYAISYTAANTALYYYLAAFTTVDTTVDQKVLGVWLAAPTEGATLPTVAPGAAGGLPILGANATGLTLNGQIKITADVVGEGALHIENTDVLGIGQLNAGSIGQLNLGNIGAAVGQKNMGESAGQWNLGSIVGQHNEGLDMLSTGQQNSGITPIDPAPPSAAENAAAVLDEAKGAHTGLLATALPAVAPGTAGGVALVGSAMALANDAITAAKFDELTAFPLKKSDNGATEVARTGMNADTLESISTLLEGSESMVLP